MDDDNLGDYKIIVCADKHLIQHINTKKMLIIEKSPFKISNYNFNEFDFNVKDMLLCKAIIGIINVQGVYFLIYAKKVEKIGNFKQNNIFEIKEVEFLAISDNSEKETNEFKTIDHLKHLLSKGFYYSYNFDLTSSFQNQSKNKSNVLLERIDKNFYWNLALYKEFINNKIDQIFFAILIYGYVGIVNYQMKESEKEMLTFIVISRKLIHNSNKIYYSTGLNDQGHVANYIETEQIMIFKTESVKSSLKIRRNPRRRISK